jgi:hypothetical protein
MRTQDAAPVGSHAYDAFEVYLQGALTYDDANRSNSGLFCSKWWRIPGLENPRDGQTAGWYEKSIPLTAYAGQTIVISFRDYNRHDGYYATYTYLDDVRLEP